MSATGTNGADLPAPDRVASPSISMAAAGGQVLPTEGFGPVTQLGDLAGADGVIDMVGLDPRAGTNSFEGAAGSCSDCDPERQPERGRHRPNDNSADFTLGGALARPCGCVTAAGAFTGTIAQVQGTDTDNSPHLDETVDDQRAS